jgi:DNA-directed RNA polymerase subunit RPC12/RpoP
MSWFYSLNGQQIGPVTDSQLEELLGSGKISRDTLVWREGMADWQPLNTARASRPPPISKATVMACAECGRTFAPTELIQLSRSWVCAQCKPIFLQRMSEGAAPSAAAGSLWRMNRQLVTCSEAVFPDRCVKCNAPAEGFRLKRVLYWQHPAYYLLLFCNILILLIVVLAVRKKAVLHIGLCAKHRAQRRQALMVGWFGTLGGLALAGIGGLAFDSGWAALAGLVVFVGSAIYGGVRGTTISAVKITKENAWVKGVHRDFLADLPEWPGT